jgi:hypothetical protein
MLPFTAPTDTVYGDIRARLEHTGRPIGGDDLLIAAQTMALGYTKATDNEAELARIDGLVHENWLRRAARRTASTTLANSASMPSRVVLVPGLPPGVAPTDHRERRPGAGIRP